MAKKTTPQKPTTDRVDLPPKRIELPPGVRTALDQLAVGDYLALLSVLQNLAVGKANAGGGERHAFVFAAAQTIGMATANGTPAGCRYRAKLAEALAKATAEFNAEEAAR